MQGKYPSDRKAALAGRKRQAVRIPTPLTADEAELEAALKANHSELKTKVLKDGKMIDDDDFNKW